METVKDAFRRLEKQYTTSQGVVRYEPFFPGDKPTDIGHHNPHLNTGLSNMFRYIYGELTLDNMKTCLQYLNDTMVVKNGKLYKGLYHRHTFPWNDPVSRDEYLGIIATYVTSVGSKEALNDIVRYGRGTLCTYNNLKPGRVSLRYWRTPRDQYLMRATAPGFKPTLFQKLWFKGANFIAKRRKIGHRNDGDKIMLWLTLQIISQTGSEQAFGKRELARVTKYWEDKHGSSFLEKFFITKRLYSSM